MELRISWHSKQYIAAHCLIVHVETFVNDSYFSLDNNLLISIQELAPVVVVVVFIHGKFMCSIAKKNALLFACVCVCMSVVYLGLRTKTNWTFDFLMTFVKYLNGFLAWFVVQTAKSQFDGRKQYLLNSVLFREKCLDDMTHDQWACPLSMFCRRSTTILLPAILIVYDRTEERETKIHNARSHLFFFVICLVLLSFFLWFREAIAHHQSFSAFIFPIHKETVFSFSSLSPFVALEIASSGSITRTPME